MTHPIHHASEPISNSTREVLAHVEPKALRTFTPTQLVIARSAGVYHWTPEGRRLFDFSSGVLVSNLGHNPTSWLHRWSEYMGWGGGVGHGTSRYTDAVPMSTYNAVTPCEVDACRRLIALLRKSPQGARLERVMWAASGSEAIQKALWAGLEKNPERQMILATRHGFHGKKGLSHAVSGSETDHDRDPRVHFIGFPMAERRDVSMREASWDPAPFQAELDSLIAQHGRAIGMLITEPYLGGGGSYHPPREYLQLLERFCRENDIVFILDEVQSNFGRTGRMFAYESYGIEPDIVVLGKGLGNGVPVAAAVGRADLFDALAYGEASDTWSGNPLSCAAVLATLDEYEHRDVIGEMAKPSAVIEEGLVALKRLPFVAHVRGERGGMVWGVEMRDHGTRTAAEWANAFVLASYYGEEPGGDGVHLLGPLAKMVIRIAPPLTITAEEAGAAVGLLMRAGERLS